MSGNVCASQAEFNVAFENAIKNREKNIREKKLTPVQIIGVVIYILVIVWAILLAVRVSSAEMRTMHIVYALVLAPVYVLAYYMGMLNIK